MQNNEWGKGNMKIATLAAAGLIVAALQPALASGPEQTAPGTVAAVDRAGPSDGLIRLAQGPRYFIVLGSFRRLSAAQAHCNRVGGSYVVNTNEYPNFRNGYFSCVIGPTSRSEAQRNLWMAKQIVPDAYVKAGW